MSKSWYIYGSQGFVNRQYPESFQNVFNSQGTGSEQPFTFSMDVLALYWPLGHSKTLLGANLHYDYAAYNQTASSHALTVGQDFSSVSCLHFFGSGIGNSFFIRADFGHTDAVLADLTLKSSVTVSGFGMLLGGGYALPVGRKSSILVNLNTMFNLVDEQVYLSPGMSLGILF